ncbi:MAG: hypothetical protein IJN13_03205 [Bacilli bacterium]|nr:hypothetical protein [Bacilli bacterium]
MNKIINIDILKEEFILEKYNTKKVNKNIIEYLIKEARFIAGYKEIKIIINNKCESNINIKEKIIEGLKEEYNIVSKIFYQNNIIQIVMIFLGIGILFLSTLIKNNLIWKEVIIIIGWVPIWKTVDFELGKDFKGRKRKKIIKRLLKSEFIEN